MDAAALQRLRGRLNAAVLVLPGQWLPLMAVFWLRFLPPLRPFEFDAPAPDPVAFVLTCAACFVPYLFPARWFAPHPVERRLYRVLGVRLFRLLAPDGDLVNRRLRHHDPAYRVISRRTELRDHLIASHTSERSHLVLLLMGVCTQVFAWRRGLIGWAVVLTVTNVIFNVYPVFHQRHKRARAARGNRLGGAHVRGDDLDAALPHPEASAQGASPARCGTAAGDAASSVKSLRPDPCVPRVRVRAQENQPPGSGVRQ